MGSLSEATPIILTAEERVELDGERHPGSAILAEPVLIEQGMSDDQIIPKDWLTRPAHGEIDAGFWTIGARVRHIPLPVVIAPLL